MEGAVCWIAIALFSVIVQAHQTCKLPEQTRPWLAALPAFGPITACPAIPASQK